MAVRYDLSEGNVALLVVDMENDFLTEGSPLELAEGRNIIGNVNALVDESHGLGIPVLFVQQVFDPSGLDVGRMADTGAPMLDEHGRPITLRARSSGVDVYPLISRADSDILIEKHRQSGFFETNLDTVLRSLSTKTVLIAGIAANGCAWATGMDAMYRGYQVVFVSDATACRSMPDVGYGAFTADTLHAVTLTLATFILGEVTDTTDVISRLVKQSPGRS
jgi:biuret amidohydrolase